MLTTMRKGVFSGFFLVILVLGAAGLVLSDAGGFFSSGIRTSDVAKVGDHTINSRPFDTKLRRVIGMQGVDPSKAFELGLVHQAVFREVRNLLLLQGANDLGIAVSNEQITDYINQIIEPYMDVQSGTKKSDVLAGLLRQNGMTESIFIKDVQTEMTNGLVRNAIQLSAMHVPDLLTKDLKTYSQEKRDIEYIVFNNQDAKLEQEANDEVLERYYKSFQERFRIPEKRSFTVAVLTKDKIQKDISIDDETALEHYEADKNAYTTPRIHKIAQALADNEGDALKIKDAAEKGTPLSRAAQNVTGDEASFIDTQEYKKGDLPEALDNDAFGVVEKGDILGPYETALGFHVLKIVDVIPESTPSFNEVKDTIKNELLEEEIWESLDNTLTELEDRLLGGEDGYTIASEYGMKTTSYKNLTRNGLTEGSKDSPLKDLNSEDALSILQTANEIDTAAESSSIIELSDSALGFVIMDEIEASRLKEFESVKSEVKEQWTKEQKTNATFQKAKALADKVNDGSLSWKDAVKESKKKAKKGTISRDPSIEDKKLDKDFSLRAKGFLLSATIDKTQIIPDTEKTIVAYTKNSSLTDNNQNTKLDEDDVLVKAELQNFQQETTALLYNALQKEYRYTINEKLLEFLYNRPTTQQQ